MNACPGLVALEGIDGSGTTSQLAPVADALRKHGHDVVVTKEPSEGDVGRLLRAQLGQGAPLREAPMALLFAADRLAHVDSEVLPASRRGAIVLCDRYLWSSLAYQSAALPPAWVVEINRMAPQPQLHVWLACDLSVAKARRVSRGGVKERFDDDARQAEADRRYRQLFADAPAGVSVRIEANQSMEAVTRAIVAAVISQRRHA